MSLTSLQALDTGDYVYDKNARYLVAGENLISNGDFSQGFAGWTTAGGNTLSADTFAIDASGPNGSNAVTVLMKGDGRSGCSMVRKTAVEAGLTYHITYKALSSASTTTTVTNGSSCYENIFFNTDGSEQTGTSGYQAIASEKTYGMEWTTIAYSFTPSESGFIVINFNKLEGGEQLADFGIYPVLRVSDDRVLKEEIAKANRLLADPRFANGRTDYEGAVSVLHELLSCDDEQVVNEAVAEFSEATKNFLDANTVDVSSYLKYPGFDGAKHAWKVSNVGGADAWTCTGGRWMIMDAAAPFTSTYMDYQVGNGSTQLANGDIFQTVDLPAGEYMFTMRGRAHKFKGRTANIDPEADITGTWIYINADTANCYPLDAERLKAFTVYSQVKEGQALKVGLHIDGGQGHWYSFDDTELRLIGGTQADVDAYVNAKALAAQRSALKSVADSVDKVLGMPEYLFDRNLMADSLAKALDAYNNSNDPDEVAAATRMLQSTLAGYYHTNIGYTNLYQDVANAKDIIDDEGLTADKKALKQAYNAAKKYLDALTEAGDDSTTVTARNLELLDAVTAFYAQGACYATPGRVALLNETFRNETYGWETDDLDNWKTNACDDFSTGHRLYVWRGTTAHDSKYAWQGVNLPGKGLYELSAEIIALNEKTELDGDATGVYLFAGSHKMEVHTKSKPQTFTLRFTSEGGRVNVGLDARENALCNTMSLSNVVLKYFGNAEQYVRDSIASNMGPARDSLKAEIDFANHLYSASRNPNGVDKSPFAKAIAKAQATWNAGSSPDAFNQAVAELKTAELAFMLSGVYPAKGTCFDLTNAIGDADMERGDWTQAGQPLDHESEGYTLYYGKNVTFSSRLCQTLANMPAGTYKAVASATYRWSLPGNFDFDTYNSVAKQPMWLVAGNDSVRVKGIIQGMDETYVADTLGLSLSDFRHGTNVWPLLERGFYDNELVFNHTNASKELVLAVGIYGIRQTSTVWVNGFKLFYYGDEDNATDVKSIETTETANANAGHDVYNLQGIKVRAHANTLQGLPQGIYIVNGKKVILR